MKKLTALLVIVFGCFTQQVFAEAMDRIAASVNDTIITESELQDSIATVKKQMTGLPADVDLRKQVLDQLINRKLQLQLAETANIKVTDADVDHAVATIAQQNKTTVASIYQQVVAQGMTKEEYRKELREQVILQKIQGMEVAAKIKVTPDEINDFMRSKMWQASNTKEYHLEDILIAVPEEPTSDQIANAKQRAENVIGRIHHGISFRKAAMAESSSTNALKGGDLGWRKLPEIPTVFADKVLQMKPNGIIGPIQAQNGFHIIRLAGVRSLNANASPLDQKKQVEQLVFQRKMEEGLQDWLMKLRSSASINLNTDFA